MNALARFEGFMQELMDRRVVRLLGGNLQPVELARAVGQAMEAGVTDLVAPNCFRILVHPEDCADLRALDGSLERKLAEYAVELAREHRYNFAAPPQVRLIADADVERGRVKVTFPSPAAAGEGQGEGASGGARGPAAWARPRTAAAPLRFEMPTDDGFTLLLVDHFPFTIGRRHGHDLVLPDGRVSRDHAVVEAAGSAYRLRDLGSHNGTLLNGQPISEADVRDGDQLAIGSFEVTVRIASEP
ncbi:MAG TPA: DUF3662 and FHA domain-containing protein [Chloroflexota bacterium]